jgi:HAD superfamily hydrolase (TIGR01549 family)
MVKAVVIDFDDTLCLTEAATFELENAALKLLGNKPQTRDIHKQTWGQPLFEIITTRSPGVDVPRFRELIQEMLPLWVAEGKIDTITPESIEILDQLLNDGKDLYILTSRTHSEVRHLLEPDNDLASRIKAFYYRDVMEFHKPDPRAFNEVLRDNSLAMTDCVYVGDSPSDAMAAKQAGLHFIASLESGVRTEKDFAALPVDKFISTFTELPKALANL